MSLTLFFQLSFNPLLGGGGGGEERSSFLQILALSISLLERLCFTVFTVPSFGILCDFPSFYLLGFQVIFRHSVF